MPIRAFDDSSLSSNRLLDMNQRSLTSGKDRPRKDVTRGGHQKFHRENRPHHQHRSRQHSHEQKLPATGHHFKKNNLADDGASECAETQEDTFHFNSNPICTPPPAYNSRPSTPTKSSASPDDQKETKITIANESVTADHFETINGCKTITNYIILLVAIVLFAAFLTLLVLLA